MRLSIRILDSILLAAAACIRLIDINSGFNHWYIFAVLTFFTINIFPSFYNLKFKKFRHRVCSEGTDILFSFLGATVISLIFHIIYALLWETPDWKNWGISAGIAVLVLSLTFWNGIIRVYLTSVQLGIKIRIIGIICGLVPIANIVTLGIIIYTSTKEVEFENEKIKLNESRQSEQICRTKYPILMVHGVFFRDFKLLNYWGRIPGELQENGAVLFYGNHQSALPVKESASELAERIKNIVQKSGCQKVNIIAHSKGGLDCRCAITHFGIDKYVASLTTVNTPHRGCLFVDYLLNKIPVSVQNKIASSYNSTLRKLGDESPDFISAVQDLTHNRCEEFNKTTPDMPHILYQSIGSKLNKAVSGKFPLNMSYPLVKHFGGENDGLVSKESFAWGKSFQFLTVKGNKGISHGDMIDLNRENLPEFDVREFYVQLVSDLRKKGY